MKVISAATDTVWKSGDYMGTDGRPTARVTIQPMHMRNTAYSYASNLSTDWTHRNGTYRSAMWGNPTPPRELFNVKSVKWSRSVDQDAATCTIELYNTTDWRPGRPVTNDADFDMPGWYTPNRGTETYFTRWGYETNAWKGWIAPDRIVRTYEGYGVTTGVPPEQDAHMYQSGTWLVDTVELTSDGLITLTCRDMARLLIDQICFPPIVPHEVYPLWFDKFVDSSGDTAKVNLDSTTWSRPSYETDSNALYVGVSGLDARQQVQSSSGALYPVASYEGRYGADAFDTQYGSWWLSNGQHRAGFVWIQGQFKSPQTLAGVRWTTRWGSYKIYVSVMVGGVWQGASKVPYHYDSDLDAVDVQADIPYVAAFDSIADGDENPQAFTLPKTYTGVQRVRYTFTSLYQRDTGAYAYHAGLRDFLVTSAPVTESSPFTKRTGNYADYSDIIKILGAWSGFHWPNAGSGKEYLLYAGLTTKHWFPPINDSVLVRGACWGDIQNSGTAGIVKLTEDQWDKQPVMSAINVVKETLGFNFWADEQGALVFRLPNLFSAGSYLFAPPTEAVESTHTRSQRTTDVVVIDENDPAAGPLISYSAVMDSANIRERIAVLNVTGDFGAVVEGMNPHRSGMERVAIWSDQHFGSRNECLRMADMINLRQFMTYRKGNLVCAGNPAIQIDDQIRIYERQTGEGYLHYVSSIDSEFDNEQGEWTYTITTHWLGDDPAGTWAVDLNKMSQVTRSYLNAMGVG